MAKHSCALLINIKAPVIDHVISSQQDEGTHLTSLSGLFGFHSPSEHPPPPTPHAWMPVFLTRLVRPVSVVLVGLRWENIGEKHSAPPWPFGRKGQVSAELRDV